MFGMLTKLLELLLYLVGRGRWRKLKSSIVIFRRLSMDHDSITRRDDSLSGMMWARSWGSWACLSELALRPICKTEEQHWGSKNAECCPGMQVVSSGPGQVHTVPEAAACQV